MYELLPRFQNLTRLILFLTLILCLCTSLIHTPRLNTMICFRINNQFLAVHYFEGLKMHFMSILLIWVRFLCNILYQLIIVERSINSFRLYIAASCMSSRVLNSFKAKNQAKLKLFAKLYLSVADMFVSMSSIFTLKRAIISSVMGYEKVVLFHKFR